MMWPLESAHRAFFVGLIERLNEHCLSHCCVAVNLIHSLCYIAKHRLSIDPSHWQLDNIQKNNVHWQTTVVVVCQYSVIQPVDRPLIHIKVAAHVSEASRAPIDRTNGSINKQQI